LLDGATRVLNRHGAARFTTNHVAEAAGVSIGSLYQYYPNKQALLLDLHARDGERLWQELSRILEDQAVPPRQRFATVVELSIAVQAAASEQHAALESAAVPGDAAFEQLSGRVVEALACFFRAALPAREADADFQAQFCLMVLGGVFARIAKERPASDAVERIATETSRMLCAHLGL
jgi:AcrR family transcriptional regulator